MSEQANPVGRPPSITPGTINKLTAAFQRGFSISTACKIAGISRETYYKKLKESSEFADRMDGAQEYAKILAGDIVLDVLQDMQRGKKDPVTGEFVPHKYSTNERTTTARWILEKTEREVFGSQSMLAAKLEDDGKGGKIATIIYATDGIVKQTISDPAGPGVTEIDPGQLLEVSEAEDVAGGETEGSPAQVHSEELQGEHPALLCLPE